MTVVDLLRHGELAGGEKYRGSTDDPLTEKGQGDMDAVWQCVKQDIQLVVTSPLVRCRKPAEAWADEANIPCKIESRFREMEYGEWEGLSREEIEIRFPGQLGRWRKNPVGMSIPGAEDFERFSDRVFKGWVELLGEHQDRHVLVVAHSGSIRLMLAHALGMPLSSIRRFSMPFTAWSRILHNGNTFHLEYINRCP